MNIFFRELRANFKSLLIWSVIIILFNLVGFSKFSAFYKNPELLAVIDGMPPALIAAFDMDSFNLTTVTGFFGIMIGYLGLALSIAAVMWGSDIISKEERDKTVEFSLTLPVSRRRLVTAKIAAAAVNCLILLAITWTAIIVGAQSFRPDIQFYQFVNITMLPFLLIQMIFLALGIFLGCALKRYRLAGSAAVWLLLAAYFASVISDMSEKMEFLKYFSPFQYFDAVTLLRENRLDPAYVLLSIVIIIAFLAAAHLAYSKRNLYI